MNNFFKKIIYAFIISLVMASIFAGCNSQSSDIVFSFNTSTPYDSCSEKAICFNEDYESVILNADILIDSGSLRIQVLDSEGNAIFNEEYNQNGKYDIALKDISADGDYLVKVQTEQTKNAELNISSSVKLVKDKEKPELKTIISNT